mmetsp:Transcript_14530/g.17382  ORF Transcript_14530/g.17382 Transcript_14530/m.17382 type:complete len:145 (+) Transcript_14530:71-505(+)
MKSGTTICGIQLKDVVILAADTRSTSGPMVADKNCEKLHYMAKNVYCAGAGTAADLQHTTEMMESQMELLRKMVPPASFVITQTSTLLPDPRSLKIPARIALATNFLPSSTLMFSLYSASKIDIAAKEPLPMEVKGSLSVEPCG